MCPNGQVASLVPRLSARTQTREISRRNGKPGDEANKLHLFKVHSRAVVFNTHLCPIICVRLPSNHFQDDSQATCMLAALNYDSIIHILPRVETQFLWAFR